MSEEEAMERDDEEAIGPPRRRHGQRRIVRWIGGGLLALGLVAVGVAVGVWGERRASSSSQPRRLCTR